MIVVTVQLWPLGDRKKAVDLGKAYIVNDGTGTLSRGNYNFKIFRRDGKPGFLKESRVENFPRKSYSCWQLLLTALLNAYVKD